MPLDPRVPLPDDPMSRFADRIAGLERELRDLKQFMQGGVTAQIPVVAALPAAGRQGRLLMLASTSAIYKDNGSSWVTPP
jgi:hypothetical protein